MKTKLSLKLAGFLSSSVFVVLLLVPAMLYGVGWWFIPKTSPVAVFLMVVVGGLLWVTLQIPWSVRVSLSKAGNKPYRPDLEMESDWDTYPHGVPRHLPH